MVYLRDPGGMPHCRRPWYTRFSIDNLVYLEELHFWKGRNDAQETMPEP